MDTPVAGIARGIRGEDIGAVLVMEGGRLRGLVTDRDLVVRVLAEDRDPQETRVVDACSTTLVTLAPDDDVDRAVALMRTRRYAACRSSRAASPSASSRSVNWQFARDPGSSLGDISAADPNQ